MAQRFEVVLGATNGHDGGQTGIGAECPDTFPGRELELVHPMACRGIEYTYPGFAEKNIAVDFIVDGSIGSATFKTVRR